MTPLACKLAGEDAELAAFDGKHLRLASARPYAPGQPLSLEVPLGVGLTLTLKSLGSVRRADGRYDVRARPITLRREQREALVARFAP